jgi:hypothetical protein
VVAIAPGEDFTAAIDRALEDCDAVLAGGPGDEHEERHPGDGSSL